jgi:hypothetical protein
MTSQIADTVIFRADNYSLIGMSGGYLANPSQFGMMSFEMHTCNEMVCTMGCRWVQG